MKILFCLLLGAVLAQGSQQMVVVVASDLNATTAQMQRYEKEGVWKKAGMPVSVTLGRSGLGYERGKVPLKIEGDGRSPAGVYPITAAFGYEDNATLKLPYWNADQNLYCIDDVNDSRYNMIVPIADKNNLPASYEVMRRPDGVYRLGAVIGYNDSAQKGRGSCIFIHLNHPDRRATSGCTAMDEADLSVLLMWLDRGKSPLIVQFPKSECEEYRKRFEGIECE